MTFGLVNYFVFPFFTMRSQKPTLGIHTPKEREWSGDITGAKGV